MKIFLSNISNNEIIPDENFPDYGINNELHYNNNSTWLYYLPDYVTNTQ